jgi:D-serine deaminase-like pyridoxal phosphate-dependent protein
MDAGAVGITCQKIDEAEITVLSTVVSRPTSARAVVDAGSKERSSDMLGMPDFAELAGYPALRVNSLREEHGNVSLPEGSGPKIGDRVRTVPNHACVVSNIFDQVCLVSGATAT